MFATFGWRTGFPRVRSRPITMDKSHSTEKSMKLDYGCGPPQDKHVDRPLRAQSLQLRAVRAVPMKTWYTTGEGFARGDNVLEMCLRPKCPRSPQGSGRRGYRGARERPRGCHRSRRDSSSSAQIRITGTGVERFAIRWMRFAISSVSAITRSARAHRSASTRWSTRLAARPAGPYASEARSATRS